MSAHCPRRGVAKVNGTGQDRADRLSDFARSILRGQASPNAQTQTVPNVVWVNHRASYNQAKVRAFPTKCADNIERPLCRLGQV
jgi:hypothetical protein